MLIGGTWRIGEGLGSITLNANDKRGAEKARAARAAGARVCLVRPPARLNNVEVGLLSDSREHHIELGEELGSEPALHAICDAFRGPVMYSSNNEADKRGTYGDWEALVRAFLRKAPGNVAWVPYYNHAGRHRKALAQGLLKEGLKVGVLWQIYPQDTRVASAGAKGRTLKLGPHDGVIFGWDVFGWRVPEDLRRKPISEAYLEECWRYKRELGLEALWWFDKSPKQATVHAEQFFAAAAREFPELGAGAPPPTPPPEQDVVPTTEDDGDRGEPPPVEQQSTEQLEVIRNRANMLRKRLTEDPNSAQAMWDRIEELDQQIQSLRDQAKELELEQDVAKGELRTRLASMDDHLEVLERAARG